MSTTPPNTSTSPTSSTPETTTLPNTSTSPTSSTPETTTPPNTSTSPTSSSTITTIPNTSTSPVTTPTTPPVTKPTVPKSCPQTSTVHLVLRLDEDHNKWTDSDAKRVEKWFEESLKDMSAFCFARITKVSPGSVILDVDVVVDKDDPSLKGKDSGAVVKDHLASKLNKNQLILNIPVNSLALQDECTCENGGACGYHEGERKCFCRNPWFGARCEHSTIAVILPLALILLLLLAIGVAYTVYHCRNSRHLPLPRSHSNGNGRNSRQYLNPNYEMEDSTEA